MVGNTFETPEKLRKTILLLAKETLQKNIRETKLKIESLECEKSLSKSHSPRDTKIQIRTLQELNQQRYNCAYLEKVLLKLENWKKELHQ